MADELTMETAFDAAGCKLSATKAGYIVDEYISLFQNANNTSIPKKMPIINRGTYARNECISVLIQQFITQTNNAPAQIVILGAGMDSLSLNLMKEYPNLNIFELDFPSMVERKMSCIEKNLSSLTSHFPTYSLSPESFGGRLFFLGCDLRNSKAVIEGLARQGCSGSPPTLLLSECVLVYLPKEASDSLVTALRTYFTNALWLTYDMISPHDRFGEVMMQNITRAGYQIPGFKDYPSLSSQEERFLSHGWSSAKAITMRTAFYSLVSLTEQKRIAALEIFDEVEEWHLLMEHYSLTLASTGCEMLEPVCNYFNYPPVETLSLGAPSNV